MLINSAIGTEMRNILRKVAIHNLGCKVNSYEAESMELMLSEAGYEIVPLMRIYLQMCI